MAQFCLTFLILTVYLASSKSFAFVQDANCGIGSVAGNTRIVGGNSTKHGEFPWMASLQYYGSHLCGASIIDGHFALTAAHCFQDLGTNNPQRWILVVGDHSLKSNDGTERFIKISQIIAHPEYSPATSQHDIALLKLATPLTPYSTYISPICIAEPSFLLNPRSPVTVIGWGSMEFESNALSNTLKKVNVYTYDTDRCAKIYRILVSGATVVPEDMVCAGDVSGGKDSCQGDSGGPLMWNANGRWIQVGIVSFGAACGRPLLAGVYTKVASYYTWIEQAIANNNGNTMDSSLMLLLLLSIIILTVKQ